jgi:hypothetical protein
MGTTRKGRVKKTSPNDLESLCAGSGVKTWRQSLPMLLKQNGIVDVRVLSQTSTRRLYRISGLGRKRLQVLDYLLGQRGIVRAWRCEGCGELVQHSPNYSWEGDGHEFYCKVEQAGRVTVGGRE